VAIHCGEFSVAESVLRRAVDSGMGGTIARRRHLLLRGWTAMLRGSFEAARADLAAAVATGPIEPRDWLLANGSADRAGASGQRPVRVAGRVGERA